MLLIKKNRYNNNQQGRKSTYFVPTEGMCWRVGEGGGEGTGLKRYGIFALTERKSAPVNNRELS